MRILLLSILLSGCSTQLPYWQQEVNTLHRYWSAPSPVSETFEPPTGLYPAQPQYGERICKLQ